MAVMISPGVYVSILDLSLYVPNLSTTILGMVGLASKGPLNEAVYVSNVLDFVTNFGSVNTNYFGPYAALQFLRYGRQMYYVRVAGPSAAVASGDLLEETTAASVTAGTAGPYTVVTANNNVFRVKINDDGIFYALTLDKGVKTAAQVATDIQAKKLAAGGNQNFVAEVVSGSIKLRSVTLGTGSNVIVDSVANGSSANTLLGFPTAGATSTGTAATSGSIQGSGVNQPYVIVLSSNDTLSVSIDGGTYVDVTLTAGSRTAAQIATDIQDALDLAVVAATADTVVDGGNTVVRITSDATGNQSTVIVTGTAAETLGLDLALHRGADATVAAQTGTTTGPFSIGSNHIFKLRFDAGNIRQVALTAGVKTAAEVAAAINLIVGPDGFNEGTATVTNDGRLKITSYTLGTASAVQVDSAGTGQYLANFSTTQVDGTGTPATVSLTVSALTEGTHGNTLGIVSSPGQNPGTFKLTVFYGEAKVEAWDNLVKTPTTSADYVETRINEVSTWISVVDNEASTNFPAPTVLTTLAGGDDGVSDVTDADFIGDTTPGGKTGMQIFGNQEDFDLNLLLVPGISSAAVINEMLLLCSTRGDCMAIVDPPFGLNVQQVTDWHNGYGAYSDHQAFNSMYGALYWPWLEIYDNVNRQKVWVPPSGLVAGVYAFTDYTTETWFAPAGFNRGHLLQPLRVEDSADLGERDLLYGNQNAVNPIVNFRKEGITIWGQRSLQRKPSALDRVNVVRLLLYLAKVLATATKYFVFEPNDPVTWSQITNVIEPYLESVKQRRGLVEFRVICDATTNPPDAIDRNEMHVVVAIKPTKAAEFIDLKFVVVAQGVKLADLNF